MNYCCKEFEDHTGTHNVGFEKPDSPHTKSYNGKWHVNGCCGGGCYVLEDIKFCPFCGKDLAPRYIVEQWDALGWSVLDCNRKKIVASFECQVDAQEHADKLCK